MSTQSGSSTASSAPQQTDSTKFGGGNNPGNLYLITFLATLFLLLFISCAIVLRSYILRRRFQQQLDDAMAAGILLAPRSPGSRKKRFGMKPKFYDVWLDQGGEKWNEMMPISAQPVQVKRRSRNSTGVSKPSIPQQDDPPPAASHSEPSSPALAPPTSGPFIKILHAISALNETKTPSPTEPEKPPRVRVDMLQIAVLVAMPSPNRPLSSPTSIIDKGDEDEEEEVIVPEVVFGVTRLPYKPPLL